MSGVGLALAGLQWVASPIVKKLLTDASTYLGLDMARELHELEMTVLPQFNLVIEVAEKSPHRDKLKAWLRQLKEAFYDAEDLLDEHEYNLLKRKAKSNTTSIKSSIILNPLRVAKSKASNLLPQNRRLIRKLNELKDILAKAREFRELLGLAASNGTEFHAVPMKDDPPPATSLHPPKVFGRESDRDCIVDLLTNKATDAGSTGYSGVAIVAHGGAGKSTLARYVYNDDRVKEHFDVRMWVCVSRKLDVHCHTCQIIESATNESCPGITNLDTLQCKLRDVLQKSDRFLLVLDDVWFGESSNVREWDLLLEPLVSRKGGNKVLVTSRQSALPDALCCKEIVSLENIEESQFLALLKHYAFSGAEIEDPRLHEKLEKIVEKIAKRLGHSPLAARVVGSQLSSNKGIDAWKAALESFKKLKSELWNDNLSEPMRALLWSFEKLDPHLKRCFLYCSLFPKGHKYKVDELVNLWVAEGLVDSCNRNTIIEDLGRDYLNKMVSGCFFSASYWRTV